MHISCEVGGNQSALVAPGTAQVEFPFLEELHVGGTAPGLVRYSLTPRLESLRAPRLKSLHLSGFEPLDLRSISNSLISIHLKVKGDDVGSCEMYLPSVNHLYLHLPGVGNLLRLKLHSSWIQAITIKTHGKDIPCPPNWTADYISKNLGTVTGLVFSPPRLGSQYYPPQRVSPFLKPFVRLKHLTLIWPSTSKSSCIDQLAPHLTDPDFLPALESLLITEYPIWPDFFQYIQQRQSGFLSGQFQTRLKEISTRQPVHGTLLEYLRESLSGRYLGLLKMPPRRKGSKEWPARPSQGIDTNGLLCCYLCHKAGLEIGCTISPSKNVEQMLMCSRHRDEWKTDTCEWNTVFAL